MEVVSPLITLEKQLGSAMNVVRITSSQLSKADPISSLKKRRRKKAHQKIRIIELHKSEMKLYDRLLDFQKSRIFLPITDRVITLCVTAYTVNTPSGYINSVRVPSK